MPTVKGDSITGENFPHQIPKGSITCADKQMDMLCEALDYVKLGFRP